MSGRLPPALDGAQLVPVPPGEKAARSKGWPQIRLSPAETQEHLASGGNVAMRLGRASGDLVDADLDCIEAMALAPIYLPATGATFGRPSKPSSHRLYRSPGAVYASFADPLDGSMLLELRADGRDGGAHLTLIPPSVADGERREWHGDAIEPAVVPDGRDRTCRCCYGRPITRLVTPSTAGSESRHRMNPDDIRARDPK